MASKKELQSKFELNIKTLRSTLSACGLDPSKDDFSEEEVNTLTSARKMIADEGKTYKQVAECFGGKVLAPSQKQKKTAALPASQHKQGNGLRSSTPVSPSPASPMVDVPALQARSANLGFSLEFGDLVELLEACEIAVDEEAIASARVEQFDEAVQLLKQGKSLQDIRSHFGLSVVQQEAYTLPDLVNTSKQNGHRVGYGQAVKAIKALGLDPNTREYSAPQAKAISKAFELVAAGESLEEISKLSQDGSSVPNEVMFEQYASRDSSAQLQTMNELADVRARGMGPVMAKMELAALLRELREGEGYRQVWKQLGDYVKARANGHNPKSHSSFGNPSGSKLLGD